MTNLFPFFQLENFAILTFIPVSKIKEKCLAHFWVALSGLLQRGYGLGRAVVCGTEVPCLSDLVNHNLFMLFI